jgi:hypothetical protein
MVEDFIFVGRHRWDVIGHYGDLIYNIDGHFQLFPSQLSYEISTNSNICQQGNDMITDEFQKPKDDLMLLSQ